MKAKLHFGKQFKVNVLKCERRYYNNKKLYLNDSNFMKKSYFSRQLIEPPF